jgi:hypothetical protein
MANSANGLVFISGRRQVQNNADIRVASVGNNDYIVSLMATKNIQVNEEIFWPYGQAFWH